jgi:hypothetical protein
MMPGCSTSTENSLQVLFKPGLFAHHSLNKMDRLCMPSFPISFVFGDKDWVNSQGAEIIIRNIRKYKPTDFGRS